MKPGASVVLVGDGEERRGAGQGRRYSRSANERIGGVEGCRRRRVTERGKERTRLTLALSVLFFSGMENVLIGRRRGGGKEGGMIGVCDACVSE